MLVPGSNLLALAGQLIGFQTARHWKNKKVTEGADGNGTPVYNPAVDIQGSIQAVPRTMYESLGLDVQREYVMFYTPSKLQDVRRDKAPDLVDYGGSRYTVESNTDWQNQDGWGGSLCVREGPAPA